MKVVAQPVRRDDEEYLILVTMLIHQATIADEVNATLERSLEQQRRGGRSTA
jgi:hypothetical protein